MSAQGWPLPGNVVMAYVRGEGPMVATRIEPVARPILDDAVWVTAESVHGQTYHEEREVEVVSRAVVVTEGDCDELIGRFHPVDRYDGRSVRNGICDWFAKLGGKP